MVLLFGLSFCITILAVLSSILSTAWAQEQSHTVSLANNCGFGVPTLDQIPSHTLATGSQNYTNATVEAVAFLNTGFCGPNGGNCTAVDLHLGQSGISSVIVDLVPTHVFSVPVMFSFFNGCDGAGVSCLSQDCVNAMRDPSATNGLVTCEAGAANSSTASVLVTFCPNLGSATSSHSSPSSTGSPSSTPSNKTTPIGPIVGGVIGGVALLMCLALALFFLRRRKQAQNKRQELHSSPTPYTTTPTLGSSMMLLPSQREKASSSGPRDPRSITDQPTPYEHLHLDGPSTSIPPAWQEETELDRIVERLADRFGWSSPSQTDEPTQPLPSYHAQ